MSKTNLLLDEHPLIIQPALAVAVGLNEAVVLQQVHYWLQRTDNEADGFKWVYNTYHAWQQQFPFWGYNTVRRTIEKLENAGLLISSSFNKLKADHTKWYRIDYHALELAISAKPFGNFASPSAQNGQANSPEWAGDMPNLGRAIPETTPETTAKTNKETYQLAAGRTGAAVSRSATAGEDENSSLPVNSFSKFNDPRHTHDLRPNDIAYMQNLLFHLFDYELPEEDIPHLTSLIATYGKKPVCDLLRDMREANRGFKPTDFCPDGFEEFANSISPDDFPYPVNPLKPYDPKREATNELNREATELIQHFEATHDRHVKRSNGGNIPSQQRRAAKSIITDCGGLEAAKRAVEALANDPVGVRNVVSLRKRLLLMKEVV